MFTTHTPVPAGNDIFPPPLVEHYLGPYLVGLKLTREELLSLGRQDSADVGEGFGMTVLALRLCSFANGVSKLHGSVSRKMWQRIWPGLPDAEVPISSITNGVHTRSWVSPDLADLYDRYLGSAWHHSPPEAGVWQRVERVPDAELWRTHERRRERLVAFARTRLKKQLIARGALPAEVARADESLDPETLTIGFARRFATYKRGSLVLKNFERLLGLISSKDRPVQFIFAGKAHPRDNGGKELIADIMQRARKPELRRRVVFLEDYDMNICRYLVQGVDVWLNNPRRPLEASGTSGMKAGCNGVLNFSILDGWWVEGYAGDNGFAIGAGEEYTDTGYQDEVEGRAIYDILEQEIVPLFYQRGPDGVPRGWVRMMKRSIASLSPVYSTGRMVAEYARAAYLPCAARYVKLSANGLAAARALAQWRRGVRRGWGHVKVLSAQATGDGACTVGGQLHVQARVMLNDLRPDDVRVQLYHGPVDNQGEVRSASLVDMKPAGPAEGGAWPYEGDIQCRESGQHGYTVRVLPRHPDLAHPYEPGLICWG